MFLFRIYQILITKIIFNLLYYTLLHKIYSIQIQKMGNKDSMPQNSLDINGIKIMNPGDSLNLFVQSILDMQIKKKSGMFRLQKDVEDLLQRTPEKQENGHGNPPIKNMENKANFSKNNHHRQSDPVQGLMDTMIIQNANYSPAANQLIVQNKNFVRAYEQLRQKLLSSIDTSKSLFNLQVWKTILQPLSQEQVYLTIKERLQLVKTIYYLIKVEFGIPFTQKQQQVHLLTPKHPLNEQSFCEEAAYEISKLKTKIMNRKTQTLKVLALMERFSELKMDFSELSNSKKFTDSQKNQDKKIDEKAFELCKNDIYAFSFITLYLPNCVNTQLQKTPEKVFDIIERLKNILKTLSSKYPPNAVEVIANVDDHEEVKLIIEDCFDKKNEIIYIPEIKLKQTDSVEEKILSIEDQIIKKAKLAKKNKKIFDEVLKPIWQKLGRDYHRGLKIITDSAEDRLTKARAFEKIAFKKNSSGLQKFKEQFNEKKQDLVKKFVKDTKSYNKILEFNLKCFSEFNHLRNQRLLESEQGLPFKVFDLLRAKAVFQKPSDIIKTANNIYEHFKVLCKKSAKYVLLQYENRLKQKTKDFQLNFIINGTISELQLALKLEKSANEFNHKLYELQRSKNLTPLITLQSVNDQLAQKFFIDQLQLCYVLKECDKKNGLLKDSKNLKQFEKLLSMNVTRSQSEETKNFYELVFSEERQRQQTAINKYLSIANSYVQNRNYSLDQPGRKELRKTNERFGINKMKN